jgi:heme/copper-type cytochrome/quinol oxidase subunit 3
MTTREVLLHAESAEAGKLCGESVTAPPWRRVAAYSVEYNSIQKKKKKKKQKKKKKKKKKKKQVFFFYFSLWLFSCFSFSSFLLYYCKTRSRRNSSTPLYTTTVHHTSANQ